jgi:hypothetical protein
MKVANVNHQGRVLDIYISFEHENHDGTPDREGINRGSECFGLTHCTVTGTAPGAKREHGDILGRGTAIKMPGDQYCKEIGRKYALTRALAKVDRQARTEIWAAYWARLKQTQTA